MGFKYKSYLLSAMIKALKFQLSGEYNALNLNGIQRYGWPFSNGRVYIMIW